MKETMNRNYFLKLNESRLIKVFGTLDFKLFSFCFKKRITIYCIFNHKKEKSFLFLLTKNVLFNAAFSSICYLHKWFNRIYRMRLLFSHSKSNFCQKWIRSRILYNFKGLHLFICHKVCLLLYRYKSNVGGTNDFFIIFTDRKINNDCQYIAVYHPKMKVQNCFT